MNPGQEQADFWSRGLHLIWARRAFPLLSSAPESVESGRAGEGYHPPEITMPGLFPPAEVLSSGYEEACKEDHAENRKEDHAAVRQENKRQEHGIHGRGTSRDERTRQRAESRRG